MNAIADSDAYFNTERMLVQHQAALTLLQGMLADPNINALHWLDVACGRGQIIAHLKENLSDRYRQKISYHGYDIENSHTRNAKRVSESLDLQSVVFEIGDLSRFSSAFPAQQKFDFVTLTNTIHEISPERLAGVLFDAIERLNPKGCLFVYDMESLPSLELGAIPWSAGEIKAIFATICDSLGAPNYEPAVGRWQHQSCVGWNVQLRLEHLAFTGALSDQRDKAVAATSVRIKELIDQKLEQTRSALDSLTQYGAETGDEAKDKEAYLYDFWALTRAKGAP